MFMQEMWITGTHWDDQLSDDLIRKVNSWFSELNQLQNIRLPRSLQQKKEAVKINLHTFVDASQGAYGAAVYVRIEYQDQTASFFESYCSQDKSSSSTIYKHSKVGIDGGLSEN